jgi:hypothetical protein
MDKPPASHASTADRPRRFRAQGLVEFALILPVMLLVIFMIVELARVLHAYLAIENGARFGVRYAVTGEYNPVYCAGFPGGVCDARNEQDAARLPSIEDTARAGSASILRDETLSPGQPGYFKITICSNRDADGNGINDDFILFPSDQATFTPAQCSPVEDAGGPGDRVSVTIDFEHPLIVPIISSIWPQLHLVAKREGIIEQFRTARVVGLPATISAPTFTPTVSNTPTMTWTPSITPTPSDTPTPTSTETPTPTFTPTETSTTTETPTLTPTPDCSLIYSTNLWISGSRLYMTVRNDNPVQLNFLGGTVYWTSLDGSMYADYSQYNSSTYWNGTDYSSPTSGSANYPHPGGMTLTWRTIFRNVPTGVLSGSFTVSLDYTNGCTVTDSLSVATPTASNTPTRTYTPTITRTPTRTYTPTITRTPTRTYTPSRTPTRTNTSPPTATRTPAPPTATRTPSRTPTITYTPSDTPTRTRTPTRTNTAIVPTSTQAPTNTPTKTSTPPIFG